jgi:phage terminase large subunit-like protein
MSYPDPNHDPSPVIASVVKPMSYKAIFAIAAARDLELEQMDLKTAFLYGDIDEEVYIDVVVVGFIFARLSRRLASRRAWGAQQHVWPIQARYKWTKHERVSMPYYSWSKAAMASTSPLHQM